MKTLLIFLVLLIGCFSCGTNNKPVSDAQKEKIKGEVKEVVNTFIKGCEEANSDMLLGIYLDSPDFVYTYNGNSFGYKQVAETMKPVFNTLINQKGTIINENYAVLDNSTVLYTNNSKWLMNFKDGHSILQDPWIVQLLIKKIDNKWKVISGNESGVEQSVPSESSKGLNQVELIKQFAGTWKAEVGKDTTEFFDAKSYGAGLYADFKYVTKGKIVLEGKQLWGYDKKVDKFIISVVVKGMDMQIAEVRFTSKNICEIIPFSDIFNLRKESYKLESEFKSPDIQLYKTIINNNIIKTDTYTRVK
jgi:hypothetical protein